MALTEEQKEIAENYKEDQYRLKRDVLRSECHWLSKDHLKGEIVYYYRGHTYGVLDLGTRAFSEVAGETPFFQLPEDCLEKF